MKDVIKTAVIAGTPVDTEMGVCFIKQMNQEAGAGGIVLEPVYAPAATDCDAQVKFQYSDEEGKRRVIDAIFDRQIADGVRDFFIYCNSLSGSFDFDSYAAEKSRETGQEIRVYTPLQIYRRLGGRYDRVGVLAAHNLSAHAIEAALMTSNPDIYAIGAGSMAIVKAVEERVPPKEIADGYGLRGLADFMKACGAEAIILGCTHFPYFKEELAGLTELPIIDPSEEMYKNIIKNY